MNNTQQNDSEFAVDWSRLQAICLRQGWDLGRLARAAGVSRTTLYHWQTGRTGRPRGSTLYKLAEVLRVDPNELLVGAETNSSTQSGFPRSEESPASEASPPEFPKPVGTIGGGASGNSSGIPAGNASTSFMGTVDELVFDRQTNWCVQELCERSPELFQDWADQEWEELFSSFGVGGELNEEGVRQQVEAINQRRVTLYELQVLLETHLADAARRVIHSLYESVQGPESASPVEVSGKSQDGAA